MITMWQCVLCHCMVNARNFILINPLMCCLLFPLFSLNTKIQVSVTATDLYQISRCSSTLYHCSHLQLDMHLKFCVFSFQWILCIFYSIREFSTFLLHWLWFPLVLACIKTSFCKAKPYTLACITCTLKCQRKFVSSAYECAYQHILSRGSHVPSVLKIGEQSESPYSHGAKQAS